MRALRWGFVLFLWLVLPVAGPVSASHFDPEDAIPNLVRPGAGFWVRGGPDASTIWFQRATTEDAQVYVQAGAPERRTVFGGVAGGTLQVRHFVAPPDAGLRVTSEAPAWVGVLPHGWLRETDASSLSLACADEFQAFLWDRGGRSELSVTQAGTMARVRVVVLPSTLVWDRAGAFTSGELELEGRAPLLVVVDAGPPGACGGEATLRLQGEPLATPWSAAASGDVFGVFVLTGGAALLYVLWRRGLPNIPRRPPGSGLRP